MYDFLCIYFQEVIISLFSRWKNRSAERLGNTHNIMYLISEWNDKAPDPDPGLSET